MAGSLAATPRRLQAPGKPTGDGKALAVVVGSVMTAAMLFVAVPAEESGRKVEATIQRDGTIKTRHIAGKQYLKAYLDIVRVGTICDGITRIAGRPVKLGDEVSEAQCAMMLEVELVAHAQGVLKCVPGLYGRTNQVFAAVSLAYNIGVANFCSSTAAKLFNQQFWIQGCHAFMSWNKVTQHGRKVFNKGLNSRRERERNVCLKG